MGSWFKKMLWRDPFSDELGESLLSECSEYLGDCNVAGLSVSSRTLVEATGLVV